MVLTLENICLECIAMNLEKINRPGVNLSRIQQEILLERLCNHDMFTERMLPSITYNLFSTRLQKVCFSYNDQVTDELLLKLLTCGCQLRDLRLIGLESISDKSLHVIGKHQHQLETLVLKDLKKLSERCFASFCCRSLLNVSVIKCCIGDTAITQLVTQSTNITSLNLSRCVTITDKGIAAVAKYLNKDLIELDATGVLLLTDEALISLGNGQCMTLQKLLLNGCNKITGSGLRQVSHGCPNLSTLDLGYCFNVVHDGDFSSNVDIFPQNLQELSLHGVPVHANLLTNLTKRVKTLSCLRLCGLEAINQLTLEEVCESLGSSLTELDLSGCRHLKDAELSCVTRHCKSLQCLAISLCSSLSGEPLLTWLEEYGNSLTSFRASACSQLSFAVLGKIALTCPNLTEFTVTCSSHVDDDLLSMLAMHCPKIESLNIKACKQVTDSGVCAVICTCQLRELVLSGINNLTDRTIISLSHSCAESLTDIYISGCTKITTAAVNYLQDRCVNRLFVERHLPAKLSENQTMAKNLDTGEYCVMESAQF